MRQIEECRRSTAEQQQKKRSVFIKICLAAIMPIPVAHNTLNQRIYIERAQLLIETERLSQKSPQSNAFMFEFSHNYADLISMDCSHRPRRVVISTRFKFVLSFSTSYRKPQIRLQSFIVNRLKCLGLRLSIDSNTPSI